MTSIVAKKIWNNNFLKVAFSNLLLYIGYYMSWSVFITSFLRHSADLSIFYVTFSIIFVLLGFLIMGPISSYLVEETKRKSSCLKGIVCLLIITYATSLNVPFPIALLLRLIQGFSWALVQMLLGATLVNDLSESKNRTLANYFYSWFSRIGIVLGMGLPCILSVFQVNMEQLYLLSSVITFIAFILLMQLKVPFRAPVKRPLFSYDRFIKPKAFPLFINVILFASLLSIYLTTRFTFLSYMFVLLGFLVTYICERTLFDHTDERAEVVMGTICLLASVFLFAFFDKNLYLSHFMYGMGLSLVLSRFLIYFIKLSGHSQRGTLMNTYFLSIEIGVALGMLIFIYWGTSLIIHLILVIVALMVYLFVSHSWFMTHKNRDFKFKEI